MMNRFFRISSNHTGIFVYLEKHPARVCSSHSHFDWEKNNYLKCIGKSLLISTRTWTELMEEGTHYYAEDESGHERWTAEPTLGFSFKKNKVKINNNSKRRALVQHNKTNVGLYFRWVVAGPSRPAGVAFGHFFLPFNSCKFYILFCPSTDTFIFLLNHLLLLLSTKWCERLGSRMVYKAEQIVC